MDSKASKKKVSGSEEFTDKAVALLKLDYPNWRFNEYDARDGPQLVNVSREQYELLSSHIHQTFANVSTYLLSTTMINHDQGRPHKNQLMGAKLNLSYAHAYTSRYNHIFTFLYTDFDKIFSDVLRAPWFFCSLKKFQYRCNGTHWLLSVGAPDHDINVPNTRPYTFTVYSCDYHRYILFTYNNIPSRTITFLVCRQCTKGGKVGL